MQLNSGYIDLGLPNIYKHSAYDTLVYMCSYTEHMVEKYLAMLPKCGLDIVFFYPRFVLFWALSCNVSLSQEY